jgi:exopolysaccharide production protein ExoQ
MISISSIFPRTRAAYPATYHPASLETSGGTQVVPHGTRLMSQRNFIRSVARVLLMLLILLLFIPIPGTNAEGNSFVRFTLIFFLSIGVVALLQHPGVTLQLIQRTWPVCLLVIWLVMTSQWAAYPDISIRRSVAYLVFYMIALSLSASFEHPADFRRPLNLALGLIFFINIIVVEITIPIEPKLGVNGIYGQKNGAGVIALYLILIMTCSIFLPKPAFTKLSTMGFAVFGWVFLFSTHAKTSIGAAAFLSITVPIIYYVILRPRSYKLFIGIVLVLLLGAGILSLQFLNLTLEELGRAIFTDLTFTNRTLIWNALIPEIQRHPWTGAGFGSFWATGQTLNPIKQARPDEFFMNAKLINEAHNGYIDITLQAGIIGLVLTLLVIARCVWQLCGAIGMPHTDKGGRISCMILLGLVLAIVIDNLTESQIFQYSNSVGYLFVLIVVQAERWKLGYAPQPQTL